jgi:2-(1,2-epoxy-1,2-dihydrophenyl)acetyl-CoA isomerase
MLAEPVDAPTALAFGLVTSVVPDDELPAATDAFARRLADGPTLAYAAIKEGLRFAAVHGLSEALEMEAELQTRLGETTDHRSATQAFLARQVPVYEGR